MIIDLVAPPMSGHLHPVLGIARALADEHDVRVISTPGAQPEIAASGLVGVPLLSDGDALVRAVVSPDHAVGSDPRRLLRQFRAVLDLQGRFQAELLELWGAAPPDLAIVDFTVPAAGVAAQRVGARWWTSCPSPCVVEGRSGPPAYLGGWTPGTGPLGHARDAAGRALTRGFKHTAFALSRRRLRELGFAAPYRADGTEAAYSPERILALLPPELEFERQLPPSVAYVGPVLFTPPSETPAPAFRDGRRTLLVTAGTHLPWVKDDLVVAAHAIAARHDVDVHVSLGDPGLAGARSGPVTVLPWVDYARDLHRYDLVVHHGGAGVLGHTLAAGLPSVVVPFDYDQFDHAARVVAAGVGVRCRRTRDLADAVATAEQSPTLRANARALAERIAARPVGDAVRGLLVE